MAEMPVLETVGSGVRRSLKTQKGCVFDGSGVSGVRWSFVVVSTFSYTYKNYLEISIVLDMQRAMSAVVWYFDLLRMGSYTSAAFGAMSFCNVLHVHSTHKRTT